MNPNMLHQGWDMNPAGFTAYTFGSMLFLGQVEDDGSHPSCCDHPGASGKASHS